MTTFFEKCSRAMLRATTLRVELLLQVMVQRVRGMVLLVDQNGREVALEGRLLACGVRIRVLRMRGQVVRVL